MLLDHIKFFIKIGFIIISPAVVLYIIATFNKIGWVTAGIIFFIFVCVTVIEIIIQQRKTQLTEEDKRYNERMLKLRQEVQRPIIQAKLEKQENGPIDLGTIATGKVTWTSEDGKVKDLFNINVNLKIK
ncbi:hypothetical protein [Actinobacillus minor]|nr:hypothetical protein [Actinobacillus minor]MDD6911071.1 hypothetical protein [Actinobacillus minor]MDY4714160.1 hypothetical protein [Actinobacillus minor]